MSTTLGPGFSLYRQGIVLPGGDFLPFQPRANPLGRGCGFDWSRLQTREYSRTATAAQHAAGMNDFVDSDLVPAGYFWYVVAMHFRLSVAAAGGDYGFFLMPRSAFGIENVKNTVPGTPIPNGGLPFGAVMLNQGPAYISGAQLLPKVYGGPHFVIPENMFVRASSLIPAGVQTAGDAVLSIAFGIYSVGEEVPGI